jgi:hypothetical protein
VSLLFKFRPLVVNPELAARIGLNEAIVLQQLNYWIVETESGVEHEGRRWIYNTLEQWQKQFPFWSVDTIKRALSSLQKKGIVVVDQLNKSKHDRTNFYTINHQSDALIEEGKLHSSEEGKLPCSRRAKSAVLHTEITTETTTENLPAVVGGRVEQLAASDGAQERCRETWRAYGLAYVARYGVEPVRNAKVNGQVKQLVQRIGADAPHVADFFVRCVNDAFIVRGVHDLGLLLARCEAYRTQWATGLSMTATRARQVDQTQANFSAADEAMALIQKRRSMNHAE